MLEPPSTFSKSLNFHIFNFQTPHTMYGASENTTRDCWKNLSFIELRYRSNLLNKKGEANELKGVTLWYTHREHNIDIREGAKNTLRGGGVQVFSRAACHFFGESFDPPQNSPSSSPPPSPHFWVIHLHPTKIFQVGLHPPKILESEVSPPQISHTPLLGVFLAPSLTKHCIGKI